MFKEQKGKCAISGVDISMNMGVNAASIDRKNSNLPYILGNCWWVHKTVNLMKWNHTIKDFIFWIKIINKNINKKLLKEGII